MKRRTFIQSILAAAAIPFVGRAASAATEAAKPNHFRYAIGIDVRCGAFDVAMIDFDRNAHRLVSTRCSSAEHASALIDMHTATGDRACIVIDSRPKVTISRILTQQWRLRRHAAYSAEYSARRVNDYKDRVVVFSPSSAILCRTETIDALHNKIARGELVVDQSIIADLALVNRVPIASGCYTWDVSDSKVHAANYANVAAALIKDGRAKYQVDRDDQIRETWPTYPVGLKHFKHLGAGTINFIGSNVQKDFASYPADRWIIDD